MTDRIKFVVPGKAQPAGSKRSLPVYAKGGRLVTDPRTGRPIINTVDDNPQAAPWKEVVGFYARRAFGRGELWDCEVAVEFVFVKRRPPSHFKKSDGSLSAEGKRAGSGPTTKPDALKLARAVEDALTGIVWTDDARITKEVLVKRWGKRDGVLITIRKRGRRRRVSEWERQLELLDVERDGSLPF